MSLRAIARRIPLARELRDACERTAYEIATALHLRDPLVPPRWMFRDADRTDGSHSPEEVLNIGRGTVQWLIDYEGLRPADRFLDVGCGIGRRAIPLAGYLQPARR